MTEVHSIKSQEQKNTDKINRFILSISDLETQDNFDTALFEFIMSDLCLLLDLVRMDKDLPIVKLVRDCITRHDNRINCENKERERVNNLYRSIGRLEFVQGGGKCKFETVTYY
jgi:hypothetical protein